MSTDIIIFLQIPWLYNKAYDTLQQQRTSEIARREEESQRASDEFDEMVQQHIAKHRRLE